MAEWRPIPSLPGYHASDAGEVKGRLGRVLATKRHAHGYRLFGVAGERGARNVYVGRAVCEAFHGPPPAGAEVDHINRVRDDDRAANLRWVSKEENLAHRVTQHGSTHSHAKLTERAVVEIRRSPASTAELAATYGVAPRTIRDARSGKLWRHVNA